ncbi:MAG: BrnT family toxin [Beijerinckiaceae bacterium]|nr:BrnT family toxin [Beijerinckiaceae bacterium]
MQFDGFDWDQGNIGKCQKHGVSIEEIEGLFAGIISIAPDVGHSIQEERFKAVGSTSKGRAVFVAFTLRLRDGEVFIRPVSARYMHAKEVRHHEKETTDSEDR